MPLKKVLRPKQKMVQMLIRHHIKYHKKNEIIYLMQKKRAGLSLFLLKIFEFYFYPGNYA